MATMAATQPSSQTTEVTDTRKGAPAFSRVAGVGGIVFVVLLVGPLFAFGLGPSPISGPGDVARYYAEHAQVLQSIQVLRASSTLFFLIFLAGLSELIYREAGSTALSAGVIGAGVTVGGIQVVLYAARQAIALNAAQIQDPAVVQTIRDFSNALDTFSSMPLAVLVVLTIWGLLQIRGGGLLGWAGLPVAVLLLLGGISPLIAFLKPLGVIAFLLASPWLAVLAIWLCLRRPTADQSSRGGNFPGESGRAPLSPGSPTGRE